jgi:tetratricopeptide (TPR) repeat protein
LLAAGLIVAVIFLMNPGQKGSSEEIVEDDEEEGGTVSGNHENTEAKLILERKKRQARISQLQKAQAAERKRKAEALKKAEEDRQRKEEEAKKKKKTEEDPQAKLRAEILKKAALEREKVAEAERKKQAAEEAERVRILKAKQDAALASKLVVDGKAALAAKQFDKASKLFIQATQLAPTNQDARNGLQEATAELNKQQAVQVAEAGRASLKEKKFDLAVSKLELASKLDPNDEQIAQDLKKALTEKKKLDAEVEKFLGRARRLIKLHDFPAAGKLIDTADKVAPGHPAVLLTRQSLENEKRRLVAEAEARKRGLEAKRLLAKRRREQAAAAVKKGKAALKAKRFSEAEQHFLLASKLMPEDKIVKALLGQAHEGTAHERAGERRKQLAEAAGLVKKGRAALAENRYQEAVTHLSRALALKPGDRIVLGLLRKAEKGLREIQLTAEAARKKSDEERRKAEELKRAGRVRELLKQAQAAFSAKKYDETEKLLSELRKLNPKDPAVTSLAKDLAEVRAALAKEKQAEEARAAALAARNKLKADFQAKMTQGKTALKAEKYDDAIKRYTEALRLVEKEKEFANLSKEATQAIEAAKKAKDADTKLKLKLKP